MKKTCILFLVSVVTVSWLCIPGFSRLTAEPFSFPQGDDKKIDAETTILFIPVDSQTKETLDDVEYEICIIDQDNKALFPGDGTFKKNNKWLSINYPSASRKVLLTLKKKGYEDCLKDISISSFKSARDPNSIEMKKMDISQHPSASPIETTNLIKVSILNEDDYEGKAILTVLTANGARHYTYPITMADYQVQIEGNQIHSARLDPEVLQENGKTYRILINQAGNECKIIPIEEKNLAIVVFITNSRYALKKQDVIDQAIRVAFASKKNFKVLYIGWVRYDKYNLELIELKNNNERQINISDVNINDTADVTLNKIIELTKMKFSRINIGEKQTTNRLAVILDKTASYLNFQDYSSENLKVKIIDINAVIDNPNGQYMSLIKED